MIKYSVAKLLTRLTRRFKDDITLDLIKQGCCFLIVPNSIISEGMQDILKAHQGTPYYYMQGRLEVYIDVDKESTIISFYKNDY